MEHFPRCVRQAWDSAEEPQEPEVRQLLRSVNPKEWQLPCYPRLGELSPDEEDFNREEPSAPCRLLRLYCPKHRPREQSPCRRQGESPAPDTTPAPGQESRRPQDRRTPRAQKVSLIRFCHRRNPVSETGDL
ncbi:hypothetical protein MJG53_012380 [Ovis ammon polii x Ovis aries]|uniref:Uncharacterized protein n=2 Tax=Ovis TaxID=9935 RepID=A0A835ZRI5_SHEEP|nr:hypothetical protein JEQ12_006883 [Ovis aries]KAI4561319.1 hypothetical protein MJT46_012009 [Ovis ammon polii x Ovis aries]KAI4574204.1 hypothetical protein MJG53_012380 [Ovis ammon polii x Ovis aries]